MRPARRVAAGRHAAALVHAGLAALLLTGCAGAPPRGDTGIDGVACAPLEGGLPASLQWLPDAAVPPGIEGASGQGGICRGRVYETRAPLTLHRLWDAERGNALRHWWTLRPPAEGRTEYRRSYAVCEAWNALDHAVSCTLPAGARVVLGSGQSAVCAEATYPKSPALQVYVLVDPVSGALPLLACGTRRFP